MATTDEKWAKVQRLEFRTFVVEYIFTEDKYRIKIVDTLAYLFKTTSISDGTQPGWLGALRFDSADTAVTYGMTLVPIIEQAHNAYGYWTSAQRSMIESAHGTFVQQDKNKA